MNSPDRSGPDRTTGFGGGFTQSAFPFAVCPANGYKSSEPIPQGDTFRLVVSFPAEYRFAGGNISNPAIVWSNSPEYIHTLGHYELYTDNWQTVVGSTPVYFGPDVYKFGGKLVFEFVAPSDGNMLCYVWRYSGNPRLPRAEALGFGSSQGHAGVFANPITFNYGWPDDPVFSLSPDGRGLYMMTIHSAERVPA